MKMKVGRPPRGAIVLAAVLALVACNARQARSQAFSAYDSNHVQLVSGYTFSVNGAAQTNLSNVGVDGAYSFGFQTTGVPIVIRILTGSAFGAVGSLVNITGIDQFGLLS